MVPKSKFEHAHTGEWEVSVYGTEREHIVEKRPTETAAVLLAKKLLRGARLRDRTKLGAAVFPLKDDGTRGFVRRVFHRDLDGRITERAQHRVIR